MGIQDLLVEAATLMGVGMLVVFMFLSILILAVNLLAKTAEHFNFLEREAQPATPTRTTTNNNQQIPHAVVAAITSAVHQYRSQTK